MATARRPRAVSPRATAAPRSSVAAVPSAEASASRKARGRRPAIGELPASRAPEPASEAPHPAPRVQRRWRKDYELPRPFLKWAGGKRQLLAQMERLLPAHYERYFEPFVGGGALFFSLKPTHAELADVNAELINVYEQIRDNADALLAELERHRHDEAHFYEVRGLDPAHLSPVGRAARTIYLNKTGFNGLYRVNSRGLFNVPFGRHSNPLIRDEANLRACSQALQGASLWVADFGSAAERAQAGDFVYFDPPYVPVSQTSFFTSYSSTGFDWGQQERLARTFRALAARGVQVLLSNSDVPELHELYAGLRIERVSAVRNINSKASERGPISEILVMSEYETRGGTKSRA